MEPNVVENMKNIVKKYRDSLDEPVSRLSSKIELANSVKGSAIAEAIKDYLELMVNEIQKMTTYVDGFDQALTSNNVQVVEETVEVPDEQVPTEVSTVDAEVVAAIPVVDTAAVE